MLGRYRGRRFPCYRFAPFLFTAFSSPAIVHASNDSACVVRSLLQEMFPPSCMRYQSTIPDPLGGFCRRRVCLFCSLRRAVLVVAVFVYAHRVERSTPGGGCVCRCRSFGSLAIMAEGLSLVCSVSFLRSYYTTILSICQYFIKTF